MRTAILAATSLLALGVTNSTVATNAATEDRPLAQTAQGAARGIAERGTHVFRGLPYAAPPVGALRWRPPQPVRSWSGIRDASSFGPVCPQVLPSSALAWRKVYYAQARHSEDCLYLNIWTPAARSAEPLPVMVFLHGGNFVRGAGSEPRFEGAELARDGVVVVTLNYRLGLLGRFAHPALTRSQRGEPLVNYDLMDQMAALRWVQANIAAFGGDPGNVTLFGQSAGAVSINCLMVSPLAKGLFHKAIVQSSGILIERSRHAYDDGPPGAEGPSSASIALDAAEYFDIEGSSAQALQALRALDAQALVEYQNAHLTATNPSVDGVVLPDDVAVLFEQGKQHPVPYLTGSTDWEWDQLTGAPYIAQWFIAGMFLEGLSEEDLTVFDGAWNRVLMARQFYQHAIFTSSTRHLAAQMKKAGAPAYRYYFTYVAENLRSEVPGAAHSSELPYVFGLLRRHPEFQWPQAVPLNAPDHAFSELVRGYWLSFAKTGDPNGGGRPNWPLYEAQTDLTLVLGPKTAATAGLDASRLGYLEERALIRRRAVSAYHAP